MSEVELAAAGLGLLDRCDDIDEEDVAAVEIDGRGDSLSFAYLDEDGEYLPGEI